MLMSESRWTGVNEKLHNLRGEQFRRDRNLRRITWRSTSLARQVAHASSGDEGDKPETPARICSGPAPPPSWTKSANDSSLPDVDSISWRKNAVSILLAHLPSLIPSGASSASPSLTELCLQVTLMSYLDVLDEIMPCLPFHLRLLLSRLCAIHAPEFRPPNGLLDGELFFISQPVTQLQSRLSDRSTQMHPDNWESEDEETANEDSGLYALAIVNSRVPSPLLQTLPATLTHLALIRVKGPILLHNPLKLCPRLILLDLSFNIWLESFEQSSRCLDRVDWGRLSRLQKLGLRECSISEETLRRVNASRWDEVDIILL